MRHHRFLMLLLSMLMFFCMAGTSYCSVRSYAVCLRYADVSFSELEIDEKIYNRVVGNPRVQITPPGFVDSVLVERKDFASDIYIPELMTELAYSMNVRYLVWLKVEEAGVEQSNHTLVPYLFRSHHKKYRMGVRMFVLDVESGKTVVSEYFEVKRKGPSALSCLDYDDNDPKLFQKYSEVSRTFDELEEEISDKVAYEMLKLTHRR